MSFLADSLHLCLRFPQVWIIFVTFPWVPHKCFLGILSVGVHPRVFFGVSFRFSVGWLSVGLGRRVFFGFPISSSGASKPPGEPTIAWGELCES